LPRAREDRGVGSEDGKTVSATISGTDRARRPATLTSTEFDRLRAQARAWEPATGRLLDQVELAPATRCLDAGCGAGETMRLMAQRVGPAGEIVGIDVDAEIGAQAEQNLHASGHRQCTFAVVDLTTEDGIPGAPFDLVYARLLLLHLDDPIAVLRRLWAAVARGGHLIIQEYDTRTIDVVPRLETVAEFRRVFTETATAASRNPHLGHHLPLLLEDSGVGAPDGTDVAGLLSPLSSLGRELAGVYRAMLPTAVSFGVTTEACADHWLDQLARDIVEHPNYAALWPLLVGVWKSKARPEGSEARDDRS
jgi:trans-aconitate methyltransferase